MLGTHPHVAKFYPAPQREGGAGATIFGLRPIGFWQALGLLVLSKILFGGFHRHEGKDMHWRRRMLERWEQMTSGERERFRSDIRRGCSSAGPPPETT